MHRAFISIIPPPLPSILGCSRRWGRIWGARMAIRRARIGSRRAVCPQRREALPDRFRWRPGAGTQPPRTWPALLVLGRSRDCQERTGPGGGASCRPSGMDRRHAASEFSACLCLRSSYRTAPGASQLRLGRKRGGSRRTTDGARPGWCRSLGRQCLQRTMPEHLRVFCSPWVTMKKGLAASSA